mmetsp:Transcript_15401/g.31051  ORF Transcript_15401/g.31051 Transcript_15401/m.31051 type:complete len:202 (+) Transcript_15401:2-607(+)
MQQLSDAQDKASELVVDDEAAGLKVRRRTFIRMWVRWRWRALYHELPDDISDPGSGTPSRTPSAGSKNGDADDLRTSSAPTSRPAVGDTSLPVVDEGEEAHSPIHGTGPALPAAGSSLLREGLPRSHAPSQPTEPAYTHRTESLPAVRGARHGTSSAPVVRQEAAGEEAGAVNLNGTDRGPASPPRTPPDSEAPRPPEGPP